MLATFVDWALKEVWARLVNWVGSQRITKAKQEQC